MVLAQKAGKGRMPALAISCLTKENSYCEDALHKDCERCLPRTAAKVVDMTFPADDAANKMPEAVRVLAEGPKTCSRVSQGGQLAQRAWSLSP